MTASHLRLVPTEARTPLRPASRSAPAQAGSAFLQGLERVMAEAREIAEAPDAPASLKAICADFLRRNADTEESLANLTWAAFGARGRDEDMMEFQLQPFIGA